MKKITIVLGACALVVASGIVACNSSTRPSDNKEGIAEMPAETATVKGVTEASSKEALVQRGRYLVTIMGCNDCHSPKMMTPHGPEPDTARLLSGHPANMPLPKADAKSLQNWILFNQNLTAFVGPWGVSYAANLTSDETGIGNWSEAQFFKAIREGKYKGMDNTRPLLPPMPWTQYRQATDEDLRAIFAFLKASKPVENRVPANLPPTQIPM